ncbi:AcrB/AcrD/AcrF family protein [Butyricimonas virosa]|jgi:cation efflux system (acrB/acrD/acrF family)|uniref:AcrB/AcrD/AcrF family protein n=1 Tax=Butyricimonas virosa TaxID=544645 RepID=A0A413IQ35_9BACT|nr:efflux RND transporter permease subunit [Butyricimonas virosa]MCI7163252.1 efflux RND transporter permease subunit [Butyricimonas virosa]MDY5012312.1 efflux RND transporter permease subunit [Butyricimonas virosa]RGL87956.1 AcrB/AcrD/AcrF family protein [Butyricimonas virosa]RGY19243.1 AcrB/AcrD/AcrF family protein [Butyricimonas virosa]RHI21994.1 AcrB/AcrD/AcrF family protein [Butyricimonas virosa]
MNSITKFAVKYPVSVLMLTLAVCLLGTISYNKLGTDLFPDLKNPALYVEVKSGQRPPEEVEKLITTNVESTAARQEGVKSVYSVTKVGYTKVTVEYGWDQDMDAAFLDLQRSVSSLSQDETIEEVNVTRYDANATPIMTIALTHNEVKDMNELRKIAENYMRNELVRVDGIADIQLNGQEQAIVEISTNPYMLEAFGLTADGIASQITAINQNVSGGTITDGDIQYTVKGVNLITSLQDIENIIVAFKENSSGGSSSSSESTSSASKTKAPVYLKDVATVSIRNKDPENLARYNGERCLGISIYKENKYNTVNAVENLLAKIDEFRKSLPGYDFHIISNQGEFIGSSINEVKDSALMGIILAVIILYIFLRRVNMTLIVSLSIPISIIATFNLMYFNGLSINIMTLGGLALGAGMLVDNAIVVMENIFRNMDENNLPPAEAAVRGTSEVAGAITASTLTTIVVFLPIVYLQGAAGELFKEQAWTVSFSLLSSLFVSILFIPMLASKFMRKKDNISSHAITIKGFGNFVGKVLKRKYLVIGVATILMIVSYLMLPLIGMEFMPKTESKEFSILVTMEPGTRLKSTDNAVGTIEDAIRTLGQDDIEWQYTLVGPSNLESQSGGKLESENQSQIKVKIKKDSKLDADYFITNINENYPLPEGVEISYEKGESALQSILGTEGAPLVIEVKGEELELLDELCTEIKEKIIGIPGIYDIKSSLEKGAPEVNIKIDRLKSGIYGIDVATVSNQVSEKLAGKDAGTFETQGETIDINIKVPEVTLSEIYDIEIVQGEKKYRLGEIADIEITSAPKEINRVNQSRTGIVTAMLEKQYSLNHVTPAIKAKLSEVEFPAKYSAKITGEEEMRQESFSGLGFALFLSILLVYMVMAAQFESLRHPFTILLTIPLAGVGCILAFLLTGQTLNMMAFIGIIMLAGIAVNSSIILVDAINRLKEEGHPLEEAIQMAAQHRVRPIIMTSATTILALLPMCFGFGEGASLRSPMALAVIGGLLTSTIMTLIVIPCVYYVIDRKKS